MTDTPRHNPIAPMLRALRGEIAAFRAAGHRAPLPQDLRYVESQLTRIEQGLAGVLGTATGTDLGIMSGVSARTGKGFVLVAWGRERAQLDPEAVRNWALSLFRAAEQAESDSALMQWMIANNLGPIERAGHLLVDLRRYREQAPGASFTDTHAMPAPDDDEGEGEG